MRLLEATTVATEAFQEEGGKLKKEGCRKKSVWGVWK
jgi:hypothetical protein